MPSTDLSNRNPVSLLELSFHVKAIWLEESETAAKLLGALGTAVLGSERKAATMVFVLFH